MKLSIGAQIVSQSVVKVFIFSLFNLIFFKTKNNKKYVHWRAISVRKHNVGEPDGSQSSKARECFEVGKR